MTALQYAAESGCVKVVDCIVKQRTSIDIKASNEISLIIRKLADYVGMKHTYKIQKNNHSTWPHN